MQETIKPATFTDAAGHEWTVRLDYATLRELRSNGFILNEDMCQELLVDPMRGDDFFWCVCKKEAFELGCKRDKFYEATRGDVQLECFRALGVALEGFFPTNRYLRVLEAFNETLKAGGLEPIAGPAMRTLTD